jgi:hypothetical protein
MDDSKGLGWGVPVVSLCCSCMTAFQWNHSRQPRILTASDPRVEQRWMIKAANADDHGGRGRDRHANKVIWFTDTDGVRRALTDPYAWVSCSTQEEALADLEMLRLWAQAHRPQLYLWVVPFLAPKRAETSEDAEAEDE